MIAAGLATDTEPARVKRTALQAALDFLTDTHIFQLNLLSEFDALFDELWWCRAVRVCEVEIEDHPAAFRAERQDHIGVHDPLVQVEHEVWEHPPVVSHVAGPDLVQRRV